MEIWNKFKEICNFITQDKGAIAIMAGLLIVSVIGFSALTVDVGYWYNQKRQLQIAADAGAIGGALALEKNGAGNLTTYVTRDVGFNNCTTTNSCTIVAINNPPTSGSNTTNTSAVEVILSKPAATFLSGLFVTSPTLQARAVAGRKKLSNCFVSLATSGIGIDVKGGGLINSPNCGLASNSTDSKSINVTGGGTIITNAIQTAGNINQAGGAIVQGTVTTGAAAVSDPFRNLTLPTLGSCQTFSGNTMSPGTYCSNITINSSTTVTMSPGIYILNNANLKVNAQGTLNGSGVTIIATNGSSIDVAGQAITNLTPSTTGLFQGILAYGDRNFPGISNKFDGGATQGLTGVLYFPTSDVEYNGQSALGGCLQIYALTITLTGGSNTNNSCNQSSSTISLFE
jgi:hypothetical protein